MAVASQYERLTAQPENPFSKLIPHQQIAVVPSFTLESGVTLKNVPVAYSTRGTLNRAGDNAMVICHALSGSADVSDWWGPLLGRTGKAFDISRFFVICINALGSPYGSASPVTAIDGNVENGRYGPNFPLTTPSDDVRLQRLLLDDLGVKQIAAVIGGSMGGALVLEYAYLGKDYVRCIVPIATSARHSAWCISWGEVQRQSIYSDPKYDDGYYDIEDPPAAGLSAARMAALLTYRSRNAFESKFGRQAPDPSRHKGKIPRASNAPSSPGEEHFMIHNDGHRTRGSPRNSTSTPSPGASPSLSASNQSSTEPEHEQQITVTDPQFHGATPLPAPVPRRQSTTYFSAQSYLRYQGEKFVSRFDANCYIAVTRKLDTHDLSRHAPPDAATESEHEQLQAALKLIEQPTLVLGIESDALFTFSEQKQIAESIPDARLERIESPEGHDAFLLQFEQVNKHILEFLHQVLPDIMQREPLPAEEGDDGGDADGFEAKKSSTFGEAEVGDITAW